MSGLPLLRFDGLFKGVASRLSRFRRQAPGFAGEGVLLRPKALYLFQEAVSF